MRTRETRRERKRKKDTAILAMDYRSRGFRDQAWSRLIDFLSGLSGLGRLECRLAVLRGSQHQHDVLAGHEPADAMDHRDAVERPARGGLVGMAPDLFLGHAGIMLERERGDLRAVLVAAADAGKAHDRTDVGAVPGQHRDLAGDVEIVLLDTDGDGALSLEEVQTAHARIFKAVDANKDGKVTLDEIQIFFRGGSPTNR